MLPPEIHAEVAALLGVTTIEASRVGGGCISPAAHLRIGGADYFLKWAADERAGQIFAAESDGLSAIQHTNAIRTPAVKAVQPRWLLLEWLPPGAALHPQWREFGARLAHMHAPRGTTFGWRRDNYIGSLTQSNDEQTDWPGFWRDQRLLPQLRLAEAAGHFGRDDMRLFDALWSKLHELLAIGQAEGPSLLHGDLWSGNIHATSDGIALIDPAIYRGHREVDLAMAELFGGFSKHFWDAYEESWPRAIDGYAQRRAAYQLYYLLVHVNLFGGGYVGQTREALRAALR
jgi:protein-ribulosamine 3-kinase